MVGEEGKFEEHDVDSAPPEVTEEEQTVELDERLITTGVAEPGKFYLDDDGNEHPIRHWASYIGSVHGRKDISGYGATEEEATGDLKRRIAIFDQDEKQKHSN